MQKQECTRLYHTAHTKKWLYQQDISTIEWPARSPDLKPIDIAWNQVSCEVYANGHQYDYTDDLKEAARTAWDNLDQTYLQSLVKSIPPRCIKTIEAGGGPIGY